MKASLERARLLLAHERYNQAEREIRGCLAENPEDGEGRYLLSWCLCAQGRYDEAEAEAEMCVSIAPDEPRPYFALAKVLFGRERFEAAAQAIDEAIRLDPNDAQFRALSAAIHYALGRWQHAADEAEMGLQVDPTHSGCLNVRAMALTSLGRRPEAFQTLSTSLRINPEDACSHASQGWTLLHARRPKEALVHFREALRLAPRSELARRGFIEAIKAHNVVYRWILAHLLWAGRTSARAKSLIFGSLFVFCYIGVKASLIFPEARIVIWPVVGAYAAFVAMTWLADPLFDFSLRFHPVAKHALTRDNLAAANSVGFCLSVGIPLLVAGIATDLAWLGLCGLSLVVLSVPLSATFACPRGKSRTTMMGIVLALAIAGFVAAAVSVRSVPTGIKVMTCVLLGVLLSIRIANSQIEEKRH